MNLSGIGDTKANLAVAAAGEITNGLTCNRLAKTAEEEDSRTGAALPSRCRDRKYHEERYCALLHNLETGRSLKRARSRSGECRNCGHIAVGVKGRRRSVPLAITHRVVLNFAQRITKKNRRSPQLRTASELF